MNNEKIRILEKYFLIFMLGSIIGFIYEEFYFLIVDKMFYYRGALWGPYLPVYGIGTLFIDVLLTKYKQKPLIVFLLSVIISGIVEYIIGFISIKLLHLHLWDYTNKILNINGIVCAESVLIFGVMAIAYIYLLKPIFEKTFNKANQKKCFYLCCILLLIFIIDLIMWFIYPSPFGII